MVNRTLFSTTPGKAQPAANTLNKVFAPAYALDAKAHLAHLAATGCLNQTFYAGADDQLSTVLELAAQVDPVFVAKTAIYARQAGHMKDMPALLLATLANRDVSLLAPVFSQVIDNGKMLRNFVQIVRSGVTGRKSLGSRPKKLVQHWLLNASEQQLLQAAVGNQPSLADMVKMVHPKPNEPWRAAWFAWLIGKPFDAMALPEATRAFERYKQDLSVGLVLSDLPSVPFQMLTALPLSTSQWAQIARAGSWQMVRQSLNTFARHGVFDVAGMPELIAKRLNDPAAIKRARVMPYQLLAAYTAAGPDTPGVVMDALQNAMQLALGNVPAINGKVVVCTDVSGSMWTAATGYRRGATSAVRCIDVAALVGAAMLNKNRHAQVLPFENDVVKLRLNPNDSVMTNAKALAAIGGGGTNCSAPLAQLNRQRAKVDLLVYVSDNQSWLDANAYGATETMKQWAVLKKRNPNAKMVCIDIQPYGTTQAAESIDVMNVGGFSDAVFGAVATFARGDTGPDYWVRQIDQVVIDRQ